MSNSRQALSDAIDQQVATTASKFLEARDPIAKGQYAMLGLAAFWRGMTPAQRERFLTRLSGSEDGHTVLQWRVRFPKLTDPTLEAAYRSWNQVADAFQGSGFDAKFAQEMREKMNGRGKWSNWTPSPKQVEQIKRLYRQWKSWQDVEQEPWLGCAAE